MGIVLFKVHQAGMATPGDALEGVAHDIVVKYPPVAPHTSVVGITIVDGNDGIARNAYFARSILTANCPKIGFDGCQILVMVLFYHGKRIGGCLGLLIVGSFVFATCCHAHTKENKDGEGK